MIHFLCHCFPPPLFEARKRVYQGDKTGRPRGRILFREPSICLVIVYHGTDSMMDHLPLDRLIAVARATNFIYSSERVYRASQILFAPLKITEIKRRRNRRFSRRLNLSETQGLIHIQRYAFSHASNPDVGITLASVRVEGENVPSLPVSNSVSRALIDSKVASRKLRIANALVSPGTPP